MLIEDSEAWSAEDVVLRLMVDHAVRAAILTRLWARTPCPAQMWAPSR
jgi:hypothetical protein